MEITGIDWEQMSSTTSKYRLFVSLAVGKVELQKYQRTLASVTHFLRSTLRMILIQ